LSADVLVGAGEGVDAVVVAAVREGAELVEECLGVLATDYSDESVAGGGGDRLCADEFGAGDAVGAGVVAAEAIADVVVGERFAGAADVQGAVLGSKVAHDLEKQ
jgi:hypothetical protein